MSAMLELEKVTKRFGGLVAVNAVDLRFEKGSISSVIGPNGAGKTTIFNIITGIYRPDEGNVRFEGRSIVGKRPDQITELGLCRTFQNIRLFNNMTVLENILVGAHTRTPSTAWGAVLRTRHFKEAEEAARQEALQLLRFVGLPRGLGDQLARNLPYGQQRRVEIARALASKPRLLLLDEPTAGMNPQETESAMRLFRRFPQAARRTGDHGGVDRARHESGHGHFRTRLCHRLWSKNRRRHARRSAEGSTRH